MEGQEEAEKSQLEVQQRSKHLKQVQVVVEDQLMQLNVLVEWLED